MKKLRFGVFLFLALVGNCKESLDGSTKIAMTWNGAKPPVVWQHIEKSLHSLGAKVTKVDYLDNDIDPRLLKRELLSIAKRIKRTTGAKFFSHYRAPLKRQSFARKIMALAEEEYYPEMAKIFKLVKRRLKGVHGLLLPGGQDVYPLFYGQKPHPETFISDDLRRDVFELAMLHMAEIQQIPLFGICRGLQLANIWHGGTLVQHVEGQRGVAQQYYTLQNTVNSVVGSIFAKASYHFVGASWHHQAAAAIGKGLSITAVSDDGMVKAIEGTKDLRFVVLLQWHPEEVYFNRGVRVSKENALFFKHFVVACKKYSQSLHVK